MPELHETINFASVRHKGQMYGDKPYTYHLTGVMLSIMESDVYYTDALRDIRDDVTHAAVLHDILEDTPTTEQELLDMGYSERCVRFVKLVTRKPEDNMTYMQKIDSIVNSGEIGAMLIKFYDNKFNYDHCLDWPDDAKSIGMRERYQRSMNKLRAGLASHGITV